METESRRAFNKKLLGSLTAFGLIETLFARDLFADAVKPVIRKWVAELHALSRDLKGRKLKDVEFQAKLEELYGRVELPELIKLLDLDRVTKNLKFPEKGAASLGIDLSKVEGLPKVLVFGKQIFACRKGRSIVPHGHDNMCTGFIVLRGNFAGKHYDRVEDHQDHYLIKPTIDRLFKPGECSTISDHKDNVHWFKAETDAGFIFNVHVMGYNPESKKVPNRVYVDPEGEKTSSGLIVARKVSSKECHQKYG
ncbi:MAG TPA: hypothetical protein VG013_11580 [Gemmataceae bacterium]|nr:hypothetical protein [Gemmataceae bacterium]